MKLSLVMRRLKISGGNSLANDEENKNEEEEGGGNVINWYHWDK